MADEIPAVDPAEVAALERAAEHVNPPNPNAAPILPRLELDGFKRHPEHLPPRAPAPEPAGLTITVPMPIEIQHELAEVRADLRDLKRWVRHTMHLAMVLNHIARGTPEETDYAKQQIDQADALLAKGQP